MDTALQTMINNMPDKTGKSLRQWTELLKGKGFEKHGQAVKFLKEEHGVTHGYANTIVTLSKNDTSSPEDLVTTQYKGKEKLKPIYDALITVVKTFGDDVTITPKKSSVSVIRNKQFALIKPATKSRIDLGLKLKDKSTTDRLENSGPFGSMCTHRVRIESSEDINDELIAWLKEAYSKAL